MFICYNKDASTEQAVIRIYEHLVQKGFKVFFPSITLKNIPEDEHEMYSFSPLQNSKTIIVIGSNKQHFLNEQINVKLEQYISIAPNNKKRIISLYANMSEADLPELFPRLYAFNINEENFLADLSRSIRKIIYLNKREKEGYETNPQIVKLLDECNWISVKQKCEKIIKQDQWNPEAHFCLLFSELEVRNEEELKNKVNQSIHPFDNLDTYKKAILYIEEDMIERLKQYNEQIRKQKEEIYTPYYSIKQQRQELEKEYNDLCEEYEDATIIPNLERKIKAKNKELEEIKKEKNGVKRWADTFEPAGGIISYLIVRLVATAGILISGVIDQDIGPFIMLLIPLFFWASVQLWNVIVIDSYPIKILLCFVILIAPISSAIFILLFHIICVIHAEQKEPTRINEINLLEQEIQQYKIKYNNKKVLLEKQIQEIKQKETKEYEKIEDLIKTKYPWQCKQKEKI